MTNTIQFPDAIRDDNSTSSDETWNQQQQPNFVQEERAMAKAKPSSSLLYSVIGKAFNTLISPRSGVNPKVSNNKLKSFKFRDLKTATRNFHLDGKLGEAGTGTLFKGWIDENMLTVKMFEPDICGVDKRWLTEIRYLGNLYHPNLVRLFGHCSVDQHRLLVYEFMPQGSLENHLLRNTRGPSSLLSWSLRMKIALEVAKGLAFLHSAEVNVIHRDLNCSNILLDSDYNAKLSDFGLAIGGPTNDLSHVEDVVCGTLGYLDPEYFLTCCLSAKSDVYGFGVVLLEILSGRRAYDNKLPSGEVLLGKWAEPYLHNNEIVVLDHHLEGQYLLEDAQKAANLALQCIAREAELRPNMDEVVKVLEQL